MKKRIFVSLLCLMASLVFSLTAGAKEILKMDFASLNGSEVTYSFTYPVNETVTTSYGVRKEYTDFKWSGGVRLYGEIIVEEACELTILNWNTKTTYTQHLSKGNNLIDWFFPMSSKENILIYFGLSKE